MVSFAVDGITLSDMLWKSILRLKKKDSIMSFWSYLLFKFSASLLIATAWKVYLTGNHLYRTYERSSPWPASSSSAQTLSLEVDLLKCMLYSQVGSPGDSALLSNSTRGTLQSTQGPCLPLLLVFSPTAAPSKCQHLFSIKRVIVSEKKIAKQTVAFERMKRNFHPTFLFHWE